MNEKSYSPIKVGGISGLTNIATSGGFIAIDEIPRVREGFIFLDIE